MFVCKYFYTGHIFWLVELRPSYFTRVFLVTRPISWYLVQGHHSRSYGHKMQIFTLDITFAWYDMGPVSLTSSRSSVKVKVSFQGHLYSKKNKTLTLATSFDLYELGPSYFKWVFLLTRPFCWYQVRGHLSRSNINVTVFEKKKKKKWPLWWHWCLTNTSCSYLISILAMYERKSCRVASYLRLQCCVIGCYSIRKVHCPVILKSVEAQIQFLDGSVLF